MKPETKIGYMCAVDWAWHVEGDYYGTTIYPSIKALRDQRKCVKGCGIVRIKAQVDKVILKGKD